MTLITKKEAFKELLKGSLIAHIDWYDEQPTVDDSMYYQSICGTIFDGDNDQISEEHLDSYVDGVECWFILPSHNLNYKIKTTCTIKIKDLDANIKLFLTQLDAELIGTDRGYWKCYKIETFNLFIEDLDELPKQSLDGDDGYLETILNFIMDLNATGCDYVLFEY